MPLAPLTPADTRLFFRPLSAELSRLLQELPAAAWERPTVAGTWRVRDVAAHLLGVTLRRLSFHRDGHTPPAPQIPPRNEREFTAFINTGRRSGVTRPGGGLWTLRRETQAWTLWAGSAPDASAHVRMSDDTAWRLLADHLRSTAESTPMLCATATRHA